MPNMEKLPNQISTEFTRDQKVQFFTSKVDLDYAYGQMMLPEETSRGNFGGTTDLKKGLYQLHSQIFPQTSK